MSDKNSQETSKASSDSSKTIPRSDIGQTKTGSREEGKDAAHKLSFELTNDVVSNTPGRPMSDETKASVAKQLNADDNMRIKSEHGNRSVDSREDAKIAEANAGGTPLKNEKTIAHGERALEQAERIGECPSLAKSLSNTPVETDL